MRPCKLCCTFRKSFRQRHVCCRLSIERHHYFLLTVSAIGLFAVMLTTCSRGNTNGRVSDTAPEVVINSNNFQHLEIKRNVLRRPYQPNFGFQTALTKLKKHKKPLLVTVINNAYLPFAHNWLCNTLYMDIHDQVLLVATDDHSGNELVSRWPNLNVISLSDESLSGNQTYQRAGYLRIMVRRTEVILHILKEGVEMLLFDLDTFWISNPMAEIERETEDDDIAVVPVGTNRSESYCGGFIFMKPTGPVIKLWTKVTEMMNELNTSIEGQNDSAKVNGNNNDQIYFSRLLNRRFGGIRIKKLSLKQFPDGKWYGMKESDKKILSPLVIHNNWIVGNMAKQRRMQKFLQWFWVPETMTCNLDLVHIKTKPFIYM